jgi:beta-aspartyl-peptidase (threonine type)
MKYFSLFFVLLFACQSQTKMDDELVPSPPKYAMVIHGGAGWIKRDGTSAEKDSIYRVALNRALDIGEDILAKGGSSLDAVESVIRYMENDSLFNAGRGAVYANNEQNELDASIMDGSNKKAGAVAGVTIAKNPISAARAVMERSEHVLLARDGANEFARVNNLETVEPSYFGTQKQLQNVQRIKAEVRDDSSIYEHDENEKFGTVGAVALDEYGHIAAGTSTGGMTNKKYGRIGDSPIIAAGTYADDNVGGVSCTGHGEFYIRYAIAYDLIAKMKYLSIGVSEAAKKIIKEELVRAGGSGGLIALSKTGEIAMEFNTPGMFRGYITPDKRVVSLYEDE